MLHIKLVFFGKRMEPNWLPVVGEYEKRLGAYCQLETILLSPATVPEHPNAVQIAQALRQEAPAALRKIPKGATVVALCVEGQFLSSEAFSAWLAQQSGNVAFLVGSSYGLDASLKARANLQLSLSAMTFPHQMARVMLLEQMYRAFNLAQGGKYHK
jgi:23S rRNA (pseudouridine1915-N3)-methyltransferase